MALVSVAAARPVPVIVTAPLAVAVLVSPAYCTMIVQLPPGLTTAPDMHVPPVMVKVPFPVPLVLATVGLAVSVSGPAEAAALLTVIVPVFVLVPPVFNAGVGAEKATVAPGTVKLTVLDVPVGVVTLTVRVPVAAASVMVQFAVSVVSDVCPAGAIVQVTPVPDTVTALAPSR